MPAISAARAFELTYARSIAAHHSCHRSSARFASPIVGEIRVTAGSAKQIQQDRLSKPARYRRAPSARDDSYFAFAHTDRAGADFRIEAPRHGSAKTSKLPGFSEMETDARDDRRDRGGDEGCRDVDRRANQTLGVAGTSNARREAQKKAGVYVKLRLW
jgi:hypothetical protein